MNNCTFAQFHASIINGARFLEYARAVRQAKEECILFVADTDSETYELWFIDDSVLRIDQVNCRATAALKPQLSEF